MHDIPIAAWCGLDAYEIRILGDLAQRVERDITPVGMPPDFYLNGTKYRPADQAESQRIAEKMANEGPLNLRDLAAMIARSEGLGCEQETLYDEVLPTLAGQLRQLEDAESTPRSSKR